MQDRRVHLRTAPSARQMPEEACFRSVGALLRRTAVPISLRGGARIVTVPLSRADSSHSCATQQCGEPLLAWSSSLGSGDVLEAGRLAMTSGIHSIQERPCRSLPLTRQCAKQE
eukprot:CAMPEP_0195156492 /NCGR_PEP_ID=MMETSP0448-20130528/184690_1 /TAXON_ID=66468 /ORGANISM="Heterocapsa triquestra, Strain CCMP 448" /LENGTH=113 /DNA_ID=CAMNT_0040195285 /DNA_START=1038 /DNA_END=1376 /DNA_ORIENTATION=-